MSAVEALRRPLQEDLSGFVALLRRLGVPHRVSEERDAQVFWVPSEPAAEQACPLAFSWKHLLVTVSKMTDMRYGTI